MTISSADLSSAATPTSASTGASSSTALPSSISSLAGNFNDFLNLLMVQLQNQDPTTPMDTNQFTSQLVQYASVEQQINTNTNLGTLITDTQSNTVLQASSLVGKQVTVTSGSLALQNSSAAAQFTAPSAEPVDISVYDAAGAKVLETTMSAQAGSNNWTWNGQNSNGDTLADGAYKVVVTDPSENALATTVTGTVTGLERSGTSVSLSLGALQTDVSTLQSVATGS